MKTVMLLMFVIIVAPVGAQDVSQSKAGSIQDEQLQSEAAKRAGMLHAVVNQAVRNAGMERDAKLGAALKSMADEIGRLINENATLRAEVENLKQRLNQLPEPTSGLTPGRGSS